MLETIKTIAGIGLMAAFGYGLHWLMFDVRASFGDGLFVGMILMFSLVWLAWKADPESFTDRREHSETAGPLSAIKHLPRRFLHRIGRS